MKWPSPPRCWGSLKYCRRREAVLSPRIGGGQQPERNLIEEARAQGYQVLENRDQLLKAKGKKLLGLFADEGMAPELDRDKSKEPSLAEMTRTAINTLKTNKKGFFLMVEGSQIDLGGHAMTPPGP